MSGCPLGKGSPGKAVFSTDLLPAWQVSDWEIIESLAGARSGWRAGENCNDVMTL